MKRYTVTKWDADGNIISQYDCDELKTGPSGFVCNAPRMSVRMNYAVILGEQPPPIKMSELNDPERW